MALLNIATIICIAPMIGAEFAVSVFINPILWQLENPTQLRLVRLFAAKLGAAMPFWYALSLLLLIAETIGHRHQLVFPLLAAASAIWAAVILFTVFFLVPINNRLARVDAAETPQRSQREHRQWDRLHRLRLAALAASMLIFLVAIRV